MKNRFHLLFISVLLGVASWTAYAQGQRPVPARPAWDYKMITYVAASPSVPAKIPAELYDDGKPLPSPERGSLPKLKELGNEGWELVTVTSHPIGDHGEYRYYLKRMK